MARTELIYLVVRADHAVTLRKRRPYSLAYDEVAVCVRLTFPDGWGTVLAETVDVAVPAILPVAVGEVVDQQGEVSDAHA